MFFSLTVNIFVRKYIVYYSKNSLPINIETQKSISQKSDLPLNTANNNSESAQILANITNTLKGFSHTCANSNDSNNGSNSVSIEK